ncbi:MAG TPA: peptidoglycan-binding protein, partial [Xanthobacteraceae bacterium]|nr:peptidoglycan-binding protein [Xanthobacteraceae bacterium]
MSLVGRHWGFIVVAGQINSVETESLRALLDALRQRKHAEKPSVLREFQSELLHLIDVVRSRLELLIARFRDVVIDVRVFIRAKIAAWIETARITVFQLWDTFAENRDNPRQTIFAALGAVTLACVIALAVVPRWPGMPKTVDEPEAPIPAFDLPQLASPSEIRPFRDTDALFTAENVRYCVFQQVRLEAIGPVINSEDQAIFNAFVGDWNGRCARFRFVASDKELVDAELLERRPFLEAEGRDLMRGWVRKVQARIQDGTAREAVPKTSPWGGPVLRVSNDPAAPSGQSPQIAEPLPSLITLGGNPDSDASFKFRPPAKTSSLNLLRTDAAVRVQKRLNELGYTIKQTDGIWGPSSRRALRRFKRENGLLADDAFDPETVSRLFAISAVSAPAARPADDWPAFESAYAPPQGGKLNPLNRADCQKIQRRLADLGYGNAGDGLFGIATRQALR